MAVLYLTEESHLKPYPETKEIVDIIVMSQGRAFADKQHCIELHLLMVYIEVVRPVQPNYFHCSDVRTLES